jgi:hypothetical protein
VTRSREAPARLRDRTGRRGRRPTAGNRRAQPRPRRAGRGRDERPASLGPLRPPWTCPDQHSNSSSISPHRHSCRLFRVYGSSTTLRSERIGCCWHRLDGWPGDRRALQAGRPHPAARCRRTSIAQRPAGCSDSCGARRITLVGSTRGQSRFGGRGGTPQAVTEAPSSPDQAHVHTPCGHDRYAEPAAC